MEPPETIHADEIVLKRCQPEFAAELTEAAQASLPELIPFMPWAHADYDIEAARGFLAMSADNWKDGTAFNYSVFTPAGELVGSCGLMTRIGPGALEIGYWIHSGHTGHGYASRAAAALAQVGLTLPGIERVVIKHDVANLASGRVAARAGFTEVAREQREPQAPGESGTDILWERCG